MAGTVTITYQEHRSIKQVIWNWTSSAGGAADSVDSKVVSGVILQITTNPDDVAAPTDNYDIVINDEDGVDVAQGLLANRDTLNSESVVPLKETTIGANTYSAPVFVDSKLTLQVSAAGATKQGRVTLYHR